MQWAFFLGNHSCGTKQNNLNRMETNIQKCTHETKSKIQLNSKAPTNEKDEKYTLRLRSL